jgi:hypothetical protein
MEGQRTDKFMTSSKVFAFPLPFNTPLLLVFIDTMTPPPDGMGPVKIPANLPELVRSAFNRARASGDVHFFPTQVTLVNVNSVPVRPYPSIL